MKRCGECSYCLILEREREKALKNVRDRASARAVGAYLNVVTKAAERYPCINHITFDQLCESRGIRGDVRRVLRGWIEEATGRDINDVSGGRLTVLCLEWDKMWRPVGKDDPLGSW